ncbi:anti-ECFsigma factor, ChrR [Ferrimonas balearica DSM 9799]|uniref:Anti-ECFsigma factor, ChrR n=1 Tax=Ferrimonas balearica (strain DSM 9799 / CCM 4581 / KCTC 23876 / PAT) TaxID=550540 RepID=E1STF2_FERBD|nr:ChrR family anti-sigma-E factor [Ferrimonas balearica]ADN77186.1 anti-ECFsigma factor, ChrR [Ferrimonas balearica DSM 9799]
MNTINHHPDKAWLDAYAEGQLYGGKALLLAAHLEFCPVCRHHVAQREQALSERCWHHDSSHQEQDATEAMLADMLSSLPDTPLVAPAPEAPVELQLEHRRFVLPRVLARQMPHLGSWSRLPGGLHQARLNAQGDDDRFFFIHMDPNTSVPQHTHHGEELTLVLHGGFADDRGEYKMGDFIHLDGRHEHQPFTDADEDCLVISALDKPLQFTSGLARVLNPLSQLFFR